MRYGVVKNGKVLFKYGFLEDQSANVAKVKNSVALPLEELPGKGAVTFVVLADKITMQYEKHEEFCVKFGSNETVEISDKAKEFLEKHFTEAQKQEKRGKVFQTQWKIGNPEFKKMRKLVWERWDKYLSEFISSKLTYDEANEDDGVSLNDLVLHSFFGDWPIQGKNSKRALKPSEINRIKNEVKASLVAKRAEVELACITEEQTVPAWLASVEATALWVLDGIV